MLHLGNAGQGLTDPSITVALALLGDKRVWFARIRRGASGQAAGEQVGAATTRGGLFYPQMRLSGMCNCNASTTVAFARQGDKRLGFARVRRGPSDQAAGEWVGTATTLCGSRPPGNAPHWNRSCSASLDFSPPAACLASHAEIASTFSVLPDRVGAIGAHALETLCFSRHERGRQVSR